MVSALVPWADRSAHSELANVYMQMLRRAQVHALPGFGAHLEGAGAEAEGRGARRQGACRL